MSTHAPDRDTAPIAVVADDDGVTRRVLTLLLQREGYRVLMAVDGEGALRLVREARPGLVFLDARMPAPDGYAVCRTIRAESLPGAQPYVTMMVSLVHNPRNESADNDLMVSNKHLLELGLTPITLEEGLLEEVIEVAGRYSDRCDLNKVPCVSFWNYERELEYVSHHLGEDSRAALASGDSEDPDSRAART